MPTSEAAAATSSLRSVGDSRNRIRIPVSVPLIPLVDAIHQAWWERLRVAADLSDRGPHRHQLTELRTLTRQLVLELLRGDRTTATGPVRSFGPLPGLDAPDSMEMTREVALALIAVLLEWQVPESILDAAYVAVGDPR